MRRVKDTSKKCYKEVVPVFEATQKKRILEAVDKLDEATRGEIAFYLGMEKSTTSARVNSLLKSGLLEECGKRKDKHSNITNYVVRIKK